VGRSEPEASHSAGHRQRRDSGGPEREVSNLLTGFEPDFESDPPIGELRIGDYRVFYDVDPDDQVVTVRAIREKPLHATMGDVT
jgi:hypothetical protein